MKITDVRAHHIRIPYDAGPASFRQGASAISALDMVVVEVVTDGGLTGWGDAFAYVCPRTTCTAVDGDDCAAGARPGGARRRRHPGLHGAGAAQPASVRPLRHHDVRDLRSRHRAVGSCRQDRGRAAASADRRRQAREDSGLCQPAAHRQARAYRRRMQDGAQPRLFRDQAARNHAACGVCRARGDRPRRAADGRHELPALRGRRDRLRACLPRRRADLPGRAGVAAGGFRDTGRGAQARAASISPPARTPAPSINSAR